MRLDGLEWERRRYGTGWIIYIAVHDMTISVGDSRYEVMELPWVREACAGVILVRNPFIERGSSHLPGFCVRRYNRSYIPID